MFEKGDHSPLSSAAAGKSHTSCCRIDNFEYCHCWSLCWVMSQVVWRPWRRMEGGVVLCEVLQWCAKGHSVESCGIKQERPYNHDSTASRLLSEVKHDLVRLVLRWGTTMKPLFYATVRATPYISTSYFRHFYFSKTNAIFPIFSYF